MTVPAVRVAMPDMTAKRPVVVTAQKPRQRPQPKAKAEATPPTSRIVTARKPGAWRKIPEDISPEEHRRRGYAAVELWHELVRQATAKSTRD